MNLNLIQDPNSTRFSNGPTRISQNRLGKKGVLSAGTQPSQGIPGWGEMQTPVPGQASMSLTSLALMHKHHTAGGVSIPSTHTTCIEPPMP